MNRHIAATVCFIALTSSCAPPPSTLSGEWVGAVRTGLTWYPARARFDETGADIRGKAQVGRLGSSEFTVDGTRTGNKLRVALRGSNLDVVEFVARVADDVLHSDVSQHRGPALTFYRAKPLPEARIAEYIGWYAGDSGMVVTVTRGSDGGLRFFGLGRLSGTLLPANGDAFHVAYFDQASTLLNTPARFVRDAGGALTGLDLGTEAVKYNTALRRMPAQPYRQELLEFANGDVTLRGVLFVPPTAPRATVVLIHGTGYNTATSAYEMSLVRPFLDRDIAVLVYDKRGCGMSAGNWRTASLHDLASDAAAAIRAARAHPWTRSSPAGVYGISEGGWVAPLVAQIEPATSFVVNHGGPAVSPLEDELDDLTTGVSGLGLSSADNAEAMELIRAWVELYRSADALPRFRAARAAAMDSEWFKPFAARIPENEDNWEVQWWRRRGQYDAAAVWTTRRVASLVLIGERDDTMIVPKNVSLFQRYAATGPALEIRVVPGADHGLRVGGNFAQGFPSQVADWILAALR